MQNIAVIGAGISGLAVAHFLKERYRVTVFEKNGTPGGLVRCRRVNGSLFHICGGHVFNSKRQDVLEWFWNHFKREQDFIKADRNAVVDMNGEQYIPYPIENHVYMFDAEIQRQFIADLINIAKEDVGMLNNFEEFLKHQFGETLYKLYFRPYNEKVWRRSLNSVPLSWLEGKLPMPTVEEMFYNNINHVEEKSFVHSSFWYERTGGSQFIADTLAQNLNILYNTEVKHIQYCHGKWLVCDESFDKVVFCGNVKDMVSMVEGIDLTEYMSEVAQLEYHGTTAVFCEIDENPYSWIYQPSSKHHSHRIICTGNFSKSNNAGAIAPKRSTATIEFTDEMGLVEIMDNLSKIPFNPTYLDHQYHQYTYPIQDAHTREMINKMKEELAPNGFYFTGRFADWEYYNMDVAMGAAMDLCKNL